MLITLLLLEAAVAVELLWLVKISFLFYCWKLHRSQMNFVKATYVKRDAVKYQITRSKTKAFHCIRLSKYNNVQLIVMYGQRISLSITFHALSNKSCPGPWKLDIVIRTNPKCPQNPSQNHLSSTPYCPTLLH